MANVELLIGGRRYPVSCRDGEEDKMKRAAALVDGKVRQAVQALGGMSEVRQLLLASLLLADDAVEAADATASTEALTPALESLADRLERVAGLLAAGGANA